ncbi:MAG: acetate--CoA ligase family protein [Rhodothermales bacterium]
MEPTSVSLEAFFRPRGIALIGASGDSKKLGFVLTRNLLRSGYGGIVHLVNRRGKRAFSRTLFSSVNEVPDPVDLAVIVVPAPGVPEELERCADRGISSAIIITGGFREAGPQGERLEEQLRDVCTRTGIRVLGPNCIGLIDNNVPLDTTFLTPPGAPVGDVGLISHSGSLCAAAIDWSREIGFGWSRIVSLGNQVDLNETDMLPSVGLDPKTKVVGMYLEGIREGMRFVEEASKVSRLKPIVALKVGHTKSGHSAVSSHTGALAGQDAVYDAAFRRAGVFRAHTTEEMFDATRALAWATVPDGPRIAILTNAGGPGVVAIDEVENQGLVVARLSVSTKRSLSQCLPAAASVENPVDMLASASAEDFAACLGMLLADEGVDAVLVILPPPPAYPAEDVIDAILPEVKKSAKPVLFTLMGGARVDVAEGRLEEARIPVYRFPEPAVAALAALVHRSSYLKTPFEHDLPALAFDGKSVDELIEGVQGLLMPDQAAALAAACGIPTQQICRVKSGRAAVRTARRLGYPVVLKAAAPGIVHKTDVGGVALGIPGSTALISALRQMRQQKELAKVANGSAIYFLQHMAPDGVDVVVGAVRDPQFGPVVMFGTGGVEAELRADVSFELAPLSREDALDMIETTEAGRLLRGYRGMPALDVNSVVDVICSLAKLMVETPTVTEFEINPLRVHQRGVLALDARGKIEPLPNP